LSRSRILVWSALALGALSGSLGLASPAAAAAPVVSGGTTTLTIPYAVLGQAAGAGIVGELQDGATATCDDPQSALDVAFPVSGGNASLPTLSGSLQHNGSLLLKDFRTHKQVKLANLQFNVRTAQITAQPGTDPAVVLFDLGGTVKFTIGTAGQGVTASVLKVDPAGASYLDSALQATFFTAGQQVGSFASSWTYAS
jgi:hypothetical protein